MNTLNNMVPEIDNAKLIDDIEGVNLTGVDFKSIDMLVDLYKNSPSQIIYNQFLDFIEMPVYNESLNYRETYWKVYTQNITLLSQLKELVLEQYLITSETNMLETMLEKMTKYNIDVNFKFKNRRPKNQIDLIFGCGYDSCDKKYGTEIALNNHIRYKHYGGTKRDRRKYLLMVINAWIEGKENIFPKTNCTFPKTFFQRTEDFLERNDNLKNEGYTTDQLRKLWNLYQKTTILVEKHHSGKLKALKETVIFISKNTKSRMKIDKRVVYKTHTWKQKKERLIIIQNEVNKNMLKENL